MKEEEFQKKLELILKKFEKIDVEIKQYFDREKFNTRNQKYNKKTYSNDTPILDDKYEIKKVATDNKYQ